MRNLLFLTVFVFLSCTKSGENTDISSFKSKWDKMNISNYEFTLSVGCYCPETVVGPNTVKVVADTIASVNGMPYNKSLPYSIKTIDELFTFAAEGLASKPYSHTIEFNATYGFPERVYFDYIKEAVDEEMGYHVTNFKEDK